MKIIITPCLLGFAVEIRAGAFKRSAGIYESFGQLCLQLMFTEEPFTIELR